MNGKPGDHPLTDIFVHKFEVYGAETDDFIRKIAEPVQPKGIGRVVGTRNRLFKGSQLVLAQEPNRDMRSCSREQGIAVGRHRDGT